LASTAPTLVTTASGANAWLYVGRMNEAENWKSSPSRRSSTCTMNPADHVTR
jgi:hypothetical protein